MFFLTVWLKWSMTRLDSLASPLTSMLAADSDASKPYILTVS
jgi:hypothetical protein